MTGGYLQMIFPGCRAHFASHLRNECSKRFWWRLSGFEGERRFRANSSPRLGNGIVKADYNVAAEALIVGWQENGRSCYQLLETRNDHRGLF